VPLPLTVPQRPGPCRLMQQPVPSALTVLSSVDGAAFSTLCAGPVGAGWMRRTTAITFNLAALAGGAATATAHSERQHWPTYRAGQEAALRCSAACRQRRCPSEPPRPPL